MATEPTDVRALLRHTVATLAYRAEKVLRTVPKDFAGRRAGPQSRSAHEILGHLGDLVEWGTRMAAGEMHWAPASLSTWDQDVARFFAGLAALDAAIAGPAFRGAAATLFQGPIADALTHVGQIALLRGIAGEPVRGESYARADIAVGRVGRDQSPPLREFDGDASKPR